MHDIKMIRANPETFAAAMLRRGLDVRVDLLLEMDQSVRAAKTLQQGYQSQINTLSGEIGKLMKAGRHDDAEAAKDSVACLKTELQASKESLAYDEEEIKQFLLSLPNILAPDVPDGKDETANVVIHESGNGVSDNLHAVPHYDLPIGFDFEAGAALAGSRFTVLRHEAARLHRALGQYMLDQAMIEGFQLIVPPLLVHTAAMQGTGQYPKFADDAFHTGDHWLIPTAEVSLTNLVANQVVDLSEPIRMTALTPCFRLEAGSAGRDTRGMIRQHQFEKVELVTIVNAEDAAREHEFITHCAEQILTRLGLRFRRVLLCAGDTGFSASKTYDIEVWMAGSKEYREISSCSDCSDFQARRMNARYTPEGTKERRYVNTLNGSALAVGRTLAAVVEQYWDGERVLVPEQLQRYF